MAVRRLPVLQNQDVGDPERPVLHWVVIGAGFVFTIWLPLSMIALWVAPKLGSLLVDVRDPTALHHFHGTAPAIDRVLLAVATSGPIVLSFVLACLAGGAMTGRFGVGTKRRHWAMAGAVAAIVAWALAWLGGALSPWIVALFSLLILLGFGSAFSVLGGLIGRRRGPR
jgi:MFS family permease